MIREAAPPAAGDARGQEAEFGGPEGPGRVPRGDWPKIASRRREKRRKRRRRRRRDAAAGRTPPPPMGRDGRGGCRKLRD